MSLGAYFLMPVRPEGAVELGKVLRLPQLVEDNVVRPCLVTTGLNL